MNQIEQVGLGLTIVLALAFYIRLIILQYDKTKRMNAQAHKLNKGKKDIKKPQTPFFFGLRVTSWPWVIAACALLVAGAVMSAIPNATTPFWWLPIDGGIVILFFFLK